MKLTKESIFKTFNSLTMPAWIKRVITLIIDYVDEVASSIGNKADLVDGKVPTEQLPSYVDDIIEFNSSIDGSNPVDFYINNKEYTDKIFYVISNSPSAGNINEKYNKKFVDFGANTSEEDWTIIEPEDGKIYIKTGTGNDQNHSFRWTGTTLIDLDKDYANNIATLNNIVEVAHIGTVSNLDDISEGDQSGLSQKGLSNLFGIISDYKSHRNSCVQFEDENLDNRLCHIIDVKGGKREFTIYNDSSLQTYKLVGTTNNFSIEKSSMQQLTMKTPYEIYTTSGGTKYANEEDFNAQFVKVMDMTIAE